MILLMNLRDEITRVIASDPRYSIEAYAFILEALNHARNQKLKAKSRRAGRDRSSSSGRASRGSTARSNVPPASGHVTGAELCEVIRRSALLEYGSLAVTVFDYWGVRSTSDIGEIVYNLIAAGDLEKTPTDSRADFDNVFDFETGLKPKSTLPGEAAPKDPT
jgi:uncharacterized repeat protein (TIGR04138 family)